ncbi:MAG: hypothetical protein SGILL_008402, partial [Bacillariaceae sp.]
ISLAEDSLPGDDVAEGGNDQDDETEAKPPPEHPNRKKQEKVQKWKQILDAGLRILEVTKSDENERQPGGDNYAVSDGQPTNATSEEHEPKSDQQDTLSKAESGTFPDLFVLDRTGVEDKDDDNAEPDSKPAAKSKVAHEKELPNADGNIVDYDRVQALSDSEDDDADKLESLYTRSAGKGEASRAISLDVQRQNDDDNVEDEGDSSESDFSEPMRNRPRGQSMISLSSATTCSGDENDFDESKMEVSFMVDRTQQRGMKKVPGPTGRARTQVVNALYKITRHLRPYAATLHVRKKATLRKRLGSNLMKSRSILQYVLDAEKLEKGRGLYKRQASNKLSQLGGSSTLRRSTSFVNIRAPQMLNGNKRPADLEAEKLIKSYNQPVNAFMPSGRPGKKFKTSGDASFARNEFAPLEEPSRKKKAKQEGSKKKGKNKTKRRRTA